MPTVTLLPSETVLEIPAGTELLDVFRQAGLALDAPCGGKGNCGQCVVQIVQGHLHSDSLGVLTKEAVAQGYVLACKSRVSDSFVQVKQLAGQTEPNVSVAHLFENSSTYHQTQILHDEILRPLTQKMSLTVPPPQCEDGLGDAERLLTCFDSSLSPKLSLTALRQCTCAVRAERGLVTVEIISPSPNETTVLSCIPGHEAKRHYGIAVDIGTTTVALQLIHLHDATIVSTGSTYNQQISCGADVISRINYARTESRREELRKRVLTTIQNLIEDALHERDLQTDDIGSAVFSGNTTMIHLLLGLDPDPIRLEPYTPTVLSVPVQRAQDIGLDIQPEAPVWISPAVGSYVGGDICAGLLCTDIVSAQDEISLFLDIGTNGELVIGNQDFLLACACSAGPAFEGGGIGCGMRATPGAIESVTIDRDSGLPTVRTIGRESPQGICGSGIISLLANLFLTGWLDARGKLDCQRPCSAIEQVGRQAQYVLVTADDSATSEALVITESDIENVLRAKASIYAACALLLKHVDLSFADIHRFYIAGGFGRSLNLEHAKTIGLIPDLPEERFIFLGNASLLGTSKLLVSQEIRDQQQTLARRITNLELSTEPAYMDAYTAALFLPHTETSLFPSVQPQSWEN